MADKVIGKGPLRGYLLDRASAWSAGVRFVTTCSEGSASSWSGGLSREVIEWNGASAFVSYFPTAPWAAQGSTGSGACVLGVLSGREREVTPPYMVGVSSTIGL
ncbi:hypothetical protein San01_50370 [Streptomyces angustmyceticus]|uniref:Uncharacterized protein n=1 Tax=Streptomyces angustmyceticus TaxID=285578 RepID=A0A5J4LLT9_9ACTN|nr:hypothetical protein San01_50370 [Streptomyces angustmyceticus]